MRGQKLKQDVIVNIVFAGIKVAALLWVIRIAGLVFLPAILGLFLLARRLSSTWANLFQLGVSQTLVRHVSIHVKEEQIKRDFVLFSLLVWLGLVIVFVPLLYAGRFWLAGLMFPGSAPDGTLTFWTGMLTLSMVLGFIPYATLVAERRMVRANLVELMNAGGFLLLAFLITGDQATPTGIIQFQTIAIIVLSLVTIAIYVARLKPLSWFALIAWRSTAQIFVKYGFPRGVITFFDMAILLIGPWLLRTKIDEAGYLIIALTLVRIIQTAINPIVQIASIVTAHFVGRQDEASISEGVQLLFGAILYVTLLTMAIFTPWAGYLVNLWLTEQTVVAGVLPYFSVLLWGILPFTVFHGLKGVIEMRWHHPLNLYTLLLGIGIQIVLYYFLTAVSLETVTAIHISIVASFWAMGMLTVIWVKAYLPPLSYWGLPQLILAVLVIAGGNSVAAAYGGIFVLFISTVLSVLSLLLLVTIFSSAFIREFIVFVNPFQRKVNISSG